MSKSHKQRVNIRQKAPSAKRCIKTTPIREAEVCIFVLSESTERQKVH